MEVYLVTAVQDLSVNSLGLLYPQVLVQFFSLLIYGQISYLRWHCVYFFNVRGAKSNSHFMPL